MAFFNFQSCFQTDERRSDGRMDDEDDDRRRYLLAKRTNERVERTVRFRRRRRHTDEMK